MDQGYALACSGLRPPDGLIDSEQRCRCGWTCTDEAMCVAVARTCAAARGSHKAAPDRDSMGIAWIVLPCSGAQHSGAEGHDGGSTAQHVGASQQCRCRGVQEGAAHDSAFQLDDLPVDAEAAVPRPEDKDGDERRHAAEGMHHRASGVVEIAEHAADELVAVVRRDPPCLAPHPAQMSGGRAWKRSVVMRTAHAQRSTCLNCPLAALRAQ